MNYLIFNLAIAIGFVTARSILGYCLNFQQRYKQRLKLARFALLAIIVTFWLMPAMVVWLKINLAKQSLFQPFVRQSADQLLAYNTLLPAVSETLIKQTLVSASDLSKVLIRSLMFVSGLGLVWQIKNIYLLGRLVKTSYQIRKIGQVGILLSEVIHVPICFSLFTKSYVIAPSKMLTNHLHFKLALAHELQHIRQKDTAWLYLLILLKIICIANPFVWLWIRWLNELQEFACDEAVVQRSNISVASYGQCLLDTAKQALSPTYFSNALSLIGFDKTNKTSKLYRRIEMLFQHRKHTHKGLLVFIAGVLLALSSMSTAYALNSTGDANVMSMTQLQAVVNDINANNNAIVITVNPQVLAQINTIRTDPKAKAYMTAALQRMVQYQPMIQKQLEQSKLPNGLLALPLTESAYKDLDASQNIVSAAGIWQVVPGTAHKYGLVINDARDDRLNTQLETKAALNYLQKLYAQFNDWNLALVAYEIGEVKTQELINQVGSRNVWKLANSRYASQDLKDYLPALTASLIILHKPALLS